MDEARTHSALSQMPRRVQVFPTVAEVADLLRLNQQTVHNWIDAGSLPAVRVGRQVRIRCIDLDRNLMHAYAGAETGPETTGVAIWPKSFGRRIRRAVALDRAKEMSAGRQADAWIHNSRAPSWCLTDQRRSVNALIVRCRS